MTDEQFTLDLDEADLPTLDTVTEEFEGGGDMVATQVECNGCSVTAPLSEIPNGDHEFTVVDSVEESADTHITVVHHCGRCGTLGATIVTSEENIPEIREAISDE
jgi:hypothetical protein